MKQITGSSRKTPQRVWTLIEGVLEPADAPESLAIRSNWRWKKFMSTLPAMPMGMKGPEDGGREGFPEEGN